MACTIILVDDDEDDRTLFLESLRFHCHETKVTTFESCSDFLDHFDTIDIPDIIVLDINMPQVNGFQCLDALKAHAKLRQVPVIMMSTSSQTEYIERSFSKGAIRYLVKPPSYEVLKRTIKYIITTDWRNEPSSREKFVLTHSLTI